MQTAKPANRDPRIEPRAGDQLHDAIFGGGAVFTVKGVCRPHPSISRMRRCGYVHCGIKLDDGRPIEQRGRCYSLSSWSHSFRDCEIVKVAD